MGNELGCMDLRQWFELHRKARKARETEANVARTYNVDPTTIGRRVSPSGYWQTMRVAGVACAWRNCCSCMTRSPYFLGASLAAIHLRVSTRSRERWMFSWS